MITATRPNLQTSGSIELNRAALQHNIRQLIRHIAPAQLIAVVKANAYGLGASLIAQTVLEAGVKQLAVSNCQEAIELRQAGITSPILVLGYVPTDLAEVAAQSRLTLTADNIELAQALQRANYYDKPLPVQLKLNTGLNRFGLNQNELMQLAIAIKNMPNLYLEGLYTHFATADEPDTNFVNRQLARFRLVQTKLAKAGIQFDYTHLSNSAAAIRFRHLAANQVRVGLAMYGYHATPIVESAANQAGLQLQPVVKLKSSVVRLFNLEEGESVGYNRTFVASQPRRLALVPIGYADGIPRILSNVGYALVNGKKAKIVGNISMDQLTLDISDIKNVTIGDEVVFIGRQGTQEIKLADFATLCGTIPHEILTGLGNRLNRTLS